MLVQVSTEAAAFIGANGGRLWVWAARPRMCCSGAPAWMHAAVSQPAGRTGFIAVDVASDATAHGIRVLFRPLGGGLSPDVLEIGMHGRRRPQVQAYWDGCLMAMA